MGLFDSLGQRMTQAAPRQNGQPQMQNREAMQMMQQELGQIKAHPGEYLHAKGYEIPEGMTDAKQITQHLLSTGQIGNQRLQQVMRMLGR